VGSDRFNEINRAKDQAEAKIISSKKNISLEFSNGLKNSLKFDTRSIQFYLQ
jgi:hypothetical protein